MHVYPVIEHLYQLLVAEGWLQIEREFNQIGDASLRVQASQIWRYKGQVDWREYELPLPGLVPMLFQEDVGGTLYEVLIGQPAWDMPLTVDALFGFAGPGSSWFVDSRVTRFWCQALSFNKMHA